MNAVPESKPKRAPKPVPAPLGTSATGRKRYRPTVSESADLQAEAAALEKACEEAQAIAREAIAQRDTWRTRFYVSGICALAAAGLGVAVGAHLL